MAALIRRIAGLIAFYRGQPVERTEGGSRITRAVLPPADLPAIAKRTDGINRYELHQLPIVKARR